MAKVVIKYLTKPTEEVLSYVTKFDRTITIDELSKKIREFLDNPNDFALMVYNFGKLCGVLLFELDAENFRITMKDVYLNEGDLIAQVIDYMQYKYINYRLIINIDKKRRAMIPAIKKYHPASGDADGTFIINL